MVTKQVVRIEPGWSLTSVWAQLAQQIRQWLAQQGLHERDAVVLLPFAALLPPLRQEFAQAGGWQVRVETALTLGASLAPPKDPLPGMCCGDPVLDRLNAGLLLRSQRSAADIAQHDPLAFEHLVTLVVDAAQALKAAAACLPPGEREAFWTQARAGVAQTLGGLAAAALESRLLGLALEWAAASCQGSAAHSDHLHALQPSAWLVVRLGGVDSVADAVARASACPALWLDLDPPLDWQVDAPSAAVAGLCGALQSARWVCDDFEAEAQAAAALVLDAVNDGRVPVALVAVDRALTRRVRALLDRQQLPVLDETGCLLATTPSGARVMALLLAALALQGSAVAEGLSAEDCPSASRDAVLDWLKGAGPAAPLAAAAEVDALESLWRGRRRVGDRVAAARCWRGVLTHLLPLAQTPLRSLQHWLELMRAVMQSNASWAQLDADPAGRQVLAALRLQGVAQAAWEQAANATRFTLSGFVSWAADTLEQSPYLPLPDEHAQVVLTPLARAFGRSFGQVVVPGADHRQLGCPTAPAALIGPQLSRLLGMPDIRHRHLMQRLALVHLVRGGAVAFTRRLRDAGEPLSESPDLAWLLQACSEQAPSTGWQPWQASTRGVQLQPVARPAPSAPLDLPSRLSASQLDVYRQCPYRFFARAVLRLDDPEELDSALAKRDYGSWLHEVLHRFHSERDYREPAAPQLQAAAAWATRKLALDEAELLPWRASFEHFSPAYLAWLAAREERGWFWADGETDHERQGDELVGTHLRGRLDRLDHGPDGQRQVIDYKTGDAAALVRQVRQPLEDTQLAFYAALLGTAAHGPQAAGDADLQACYLALDDAKAPKVIEHPQVAHTALIMVQSLAGEWLRLRQGEPLLALGEGAVCDSCEARGLCRRDHWARQAP